MRLPWSAHTERVRASLFFMDRSRAMRSRPRTGLPIVVMAIVTMCLLGASCSSQSEDSTAVRPFDEVQASPLAFELDPSDSSRGVFRVTTTEPMICAIVWGDDAALGRFNNSLSMNGTGIVQHDVVLPDVVPGTDYHYVVQGTTADGTLYRSEVSTFRLDDRSGPTTTAVDRGPNLARDATVVDLSSEFSSEFSGTNAIDGDTATEWATRGDGDSGFITLDFGNVVAFGGIEFITRSMADGSAVTSTVTVTVDDQAPSAPFQAGTVASPSFSELIATGRRLRFDVERSTGGNVGAVEIRVFGRSA